MNRLCGSGLQAVADAARPIATGEADLVHRRRRRADDRAPRSSWPSRRRRSRAATPTMYDTTLGWRFVNPTHGGDARTLRMGETAENVAEKCGSRARRRTRSRCAASSAAAAATATGRFADEIVAGASRQRKGDRVVVDADEHPRPDTTLEKLAEAAAGFRKDGTVTAGNASGLNDGAAAVLLASASRRRTARAARRWRASSRRRSPGVDPRYMGIGPVPATPQGARARGPDARDSISSSSTRRSRRSRWPASSELGLDPARVNVNGGAIALGPPARRSGARLIVDAGARAAPHGAAGSAWPRCASASGRASRVLIERA